MTQGVAALLSDDEGKVLPDRLNALRRALAGFNDWSDGDDPHGEHDFGAFDLFGQRLCFKIDYFHPDYDTLSPVPPSIELCRRVLTIMLADEY